MPMFIDPSARVPVTLGENTIYIKAKMDAATKAAVQDEIRAKGDSAETLEMRGLGSYRLLLLIHNIVTWEGPDFADAQGRVVPCTRANISRLDPSNPLVELVAERIGELNTEPESPDPN